MNAEAQGALEYLIIVAAVLGITAVVVAFMTGVFGGQKSQASLSECKSVASDCAIKLETTTNPDCSSCETACLGVGDETKNINKCKAGNVTGIQE